MEKKSHKTEQNCNFHEIEKNSHYPKKKKKTKPKPDKVFLLIVNRHDTGAA